MRSDQQMQQSWKRCVAFNDANPVGTPVKYHPVIGSDEGVQETRTRSEAWTLSNGEPLVMVEGQTGGVSLDAVEVSED